MPYVVTVENESMVSLTMPWSTGGDGMREFLAAAMVMCSSALAWMQTPANDDPLARVPWLIASYVICRAGVLDAFRLRQRRTSTLRVPAVETGFVSAWQEFHGRA